MLLQPLGAFMPPVFGRGQSQPNRLDTRGYTNDCGLGRKHWAGTRNGLYNTKTFMSMSAAFPTRSLFVCYGRHSNLQVKTLYMSCSLPFNWKILTLTVTPSLLWTKGTIWMRWTRKEPSITQDYKLLRLLTWSNLRGGTLGASTMLSQRGHRSAFFMTCQL